MRKGETKKRQNEACEKMGKERRPDQRTENETRQEEVETSLEERLGKEWR